jgi:hypothetical protein
MGWPRVVFLYAPLAIAGTVGVGALSAHLSTTPVQRAQVAVSVAQVALSSAARDVSIRCPTVIVERYRAAECAELRARLERRENALYDARGELQYQTRIAPRAAPVAPERRPLRGDG